MSTSDLISQLLDDAYTQDPNLKALLESFLKIAFRITGTDTGTIFVLDSSSGSDASKNGLSSTVRILEKIVVGARREKKEIFEDIHRLGNKSIYRSVMETKQTYVCNDVEQCPAYFPLLNGINASMGTPILYQDQVLGIIVVESPKKDHFTEVHRLTLEALARQLAALVRRTQLAEWTRDSGCELRLIGRSLAIKRMETQVERFAAADCPVLITGETGAGKELIAHAIHFNSTRKDRPFVVVNCGAFTSDELLASDLFGHVKGSFTDAKTDKKGKFDLADGGTIFLDEVTCMRPAMQITLLRVLRYGEIQKVGDERARRTVDVRVITAGNRDLKELIEKGFFREDLYSRLKVAEIRVPPLRERKEDIPLLVKYFLEKFSKKDRIPLKSVPPAVMNALIDYNWPDNVAGLENAIRSAMLLASGPGIELKDIPEDVRANGKPLLSNRGGYLWRAEEVYRTLTLGQASFWDLVYEPFKNHDITRGDIKKLLSLPLKQTRGNYRKAAEMLGIADSKGYKKFLAFLVNNRCITEASQENLGLGSEFLDFIESLDSSTRRDIEIQIS